MRHQKYIVLLLIIPFVLKLFLVPTASSLVTRVQKTTNGTWRQQTSMSTTSEYLQLSHILQNTHAMTYGGTEFELINLQSIQGGTLWNYTTSGDANAVAVGDFNNDGTDDVLVGCSGEYASTEGFDIYAIDGENGGKLWQYTNSTWIVRVVAVGDFNNDGNDDALAGSLDQTIYAINGKNGETLWTYTIPGLEAAVHDIAVGDFNGDGIDDALVGNQDDNVYAINGVNGNLIWKYTTNYDVFAVAVGSFNADGVDDALIGVRSVKGSGYFWSGTVYAINGADGTKIWEIVIETSEGIVNDTNDVAVGDFNGDGNDDALVGSRNGYVYAINGKNGNLLYSNPPKPDGAVRTVAVTDFDNNGKDDVIAGKANGKVYAISDNGDTLWINTDPDDQVWAVAVGDFNADGVDDALVGSDDNKVYMIDGTNGETIWWRKMSPGLSHVRSVAVGDFDGNGVDDALAGSMDNNVYALTLAIDSDADGLNNIKEAEEGTDPNIVDTDRDGLSDKDEVITLGTDPTTADTDGDGLSDGGEINTYQTDPLISDSDTDGLPDGQEINIYNSNPLEVDTDGDGLPDGAEVEIYGTNPTVTDTDGDGLADGEEVNTYGTNPTNADTDADGVKDGEEVQNGTDPLKRDIVGEFFLIHPLFVLFSGLSLLIGFRRR